jgi:hypothetical protein
MKLERCMVTLQSLNALGQKTIAQCGYVSVSAANGSKLPENFYAMDTHNLVVVLAQKN